MFEPLHLIIKEYLAEPEIAVVRAAFELAAVAHQGQKRVSGEAYITHPLAVAELLAQIRMDHQTLAAALMHDVLEDTAVTRPMLEQQFGEEITTLVDGVSKLTQIAFSSQAHKQAENLQKVILAMIQDLRVIIIKFYDRLHNMRTLGSMPSTKKQRIARETLDIYAPIAYRLGMHQIKDELEDLCFAALYPIRQQTLAQNLKELDQKYRPELESMLEQIKKSLQHNTISLDAIELKRNHLYGIYQHMKMKRLTLAEIKEIYRIRIITRDINSCYLALGVVHQIFQPIPEQFKDYIAIPKANGYRSLHTILFGPHALPINVQIRTTHMNLLADLGIVSFWQIERDSADALTDAKLRANTWIKNLIDLQNRTGDSLEFIESVKIDLFKDEIYVFTPKGEIVKLPVGSTAIDFAYAIHSDVGNNCIAVKIDQQLVPLSTHLKNGQRVDIITSANAKPHAAWLDFVATAKARSHIRHFLKKQQQDESQELGEKLYTHALQQYGLKEKDIPKSIFKKFLVAHQLSDLNQLYEALGQGTLTAAVVVAQLLALQGRDLTQVQLEHPALIIKGCEGMVIDYAHCCRPIPRDPIIGELSAGTGIIIHRENCSQCKNLRQSNKQILLQWSDHMVGSFKAEILVEIKNKRGALAELTKIISDNDTDIENISVDKSDGFYSTLSLTVLLKNREDLDHLLHHIRILKYVANAFRK